MVYSKVIHRMPAMDYITAEAAEHGGPQQLGNTRLGSNPIVQVPRAAASQVHSEHHQECSAMAGPASAAPVRQGTETHSESRYTCIPLYLYTSLLSRGRIIA
jgi:hypothetical protein